MLRYRLRNLDAEETAEIKDVKLDLVGCDDRSQGTRRVTPASLLETSAVPPRAAVAGTLTMSAPEARSLCYVNAAFTGGSTPGGYNVVGNVSMQVGRSPAAMAVPAARTAALNLASRLLGNPRVITQRDILRLEDEGKIPRGVLSAAPDDPRAATTPQPPAPAAAKPPTGGAAGRPEAAGTGRR